MEDLKKAIKERSLIIGTRRSMLLLQQGKLSKIYRSANCPLFISKQMDHYAKIFNTPIIPLNENNEEFGLLCKKPFAISVAGIA